MAFPAILFLRKKNVLNISLSVNVTIEKADGAFIDLYPLCAFKGLGLGQELMNVVGKVIQVTPPHEMAAL